MKKPLEGGTHPVVTLSSFMKGIYTRNLYDSLQNSLPAVRSILELFTCMHTLLQSLINRFYIEIISDNYTDLCTFTHSALPPW